jgi:hypothetical protein
MEVHGDLFVRRDWDSEHGRDRRNKGGSGGCEEIDFPDFIRVLFLKGNVFLDLSNRLEGILTRSFPTPDRS